MSVKFAGKVRKGGNSYIVGVPIAYVRGGILTPGKQYTFTVEENADAKQSV